MEARKREERRGEERKGEEKKGVCILGNDLWMSFIRINESVGYMIGWAYD